MIALCEACCKRFNARERWEETCIGSGQCMACGAVVPSNTRYPFAVFKGDVSEIEKERGE